MRNSAEADPHGGIVEISQVGGLHHRYELIATDPAVGTLLRCTIFEGPSLSSSHVSGDPQPDFAQTQRNLNLGERLPADSTSGSSLW